MPRLTSKEKEWLQAYFLGGYKDPETNKPLTLNQVAKRLGILRKVIVYWEGKFLAEEHTNVCGISQSHSLRGSLDDPVWVELTRQAESGDPKAMDLYVKYLPKFLEKSETLMAQPECQPFSAQTTTLYPSTFTHPEFDADEALRLIEYLQGQFLSEAPAEGTLSDHS